MTTRQYLPSLGRFTTRDVLGGDPANPPSLNQWVYGVGSPITFTDPTGLSSTPGTIREAPSSTAPASTIGALEEEQCDYTCEFWALAERPDLAPIFGLAATELPERLALLAERVLDNILSSYCPDGRPSRENPTSTCGPLSAEARGAVQQVRDAATVQDLVCRAGPPCDLIDGSGLVATGVALGLDAIIHDVPATACAFAPVMSYIPGDYPLVVFGAKTVFGRVALSWLKQAGKVLTSGPGEVALNVRKGLVWVSGASTAIHAGCRVAGAYG